MKIFLLGATGNAGQRILRAALARAHEVTAMVRDEAKLPSSPNLRVTGGIVDKSPDLASVMTGHDAGGAEEKDFHNSTFEFHHRPSVARTVQRA